MRNVLHSGNHAQQLFMLCVTFLLTSCSPVMETIEMKTIQIDFRNKKFVDGFQDSLASIQQGDFFCIEIDNINLNLYNVTIGKTDSAVSKPLQVPSFTTLGITDFTKLLISPFGSTIAPMEYAELKTPTEGGNPDVDSLFRATFNSLYKDISRLQEIKHGIDSTVFKYNKYLIKAQLEDIDTAKNFEPSWTSLVTLYRTLDSLRTLIYNLNKDATINSQTYNIARIDQTFIKAIKNDSTTYKPFDSYLIQNFGALTASTSQTIDSLSAQKTFQYMSTLAGAKNNESSIYKSLPYQFKNEQTSLNIKIQPKPTSSLLQSYETVLTLPIENRMIWGISSGFYWGYQMPNQAYSFKHNADSTYSLIPEETASTEIGLNAMVHFGYQIARIRKIPKIGLELGFGPGLSISDKIRPRLMGSIGLTIGNRNELLIDWGAIYGYVDKLSNAFDTSSHYITQPGNPVVSSLKQGWFLSVSYLFY
jgi:hypothetical protein